MQDTTRPSGLDDAPASEALYAAYQRRGGLACADELARCVEEDAPGAALELARRITEGDMLGFAEQQAFWIPLFQFGAGLSVRPGVRKVLAELSSDYEPGRLAAWFVEPNDWLDRAMPIDVIETDLGAVLEAARADRFVAAG
jgi:hypothetical protein